MCLYDTKSPQDRGFVITVFVEMLDRIQRLRREPSYGENPVTGFRDRRVTAKAPVFTGDLSPREWISDQARVGLRWLARDGP